MRIEDVPAENAQMIAQIAAILMAGFRENWPDAWSTLEAALEEVHESLAPERISRVALDELGNVLGWIGGLPENDGNVWELHPMVVHPTVQRQGIGKALVLDFEKQVALRGGVTILLGTDDENSMTTLAHVNLYENLWEKIQHIRNLKNHPYEFYQKLGFTIVGVIPDANGHGKPDILMAKAVNFAK